MLASLRSDSDSDGLFPLPEFLRMRRPLASGLPGRFHWNIQNAISSEISTLLNRGEVTRVDGWPEGGSEDASAEDQLLNRYADPSQYHAYHLARQPQSPEEITQINEELEWRHDLFLEVAGDDDEFIRYLDALDRGVEKPALIAQEWKVDVKEIYALESRFRRWLRKVWQSRNNNSQNSR